ncbi:sensor histidine kinase KdpD [Geobacter sp. DSM 9736]|uniref:sensor histidine kinase n=1 Tax=Geobacter sp. DSM 9736 TaxID=1277350 RepID=UPI000B50DF45|nr:HAMP domain-containing sensor histidine kinase [Geobacter sp. DSM 9736]SNB46404.1 His Kinase A (phospho-acceptor) domain-containing protein [Geobacter sp. DSM 9736]
MKWLRNLLHPLVALIAIQLLWVLLVVFWINWFVGRHKEFRELAARYGLPLVKPGLDWIVLAEGLVLLAAILAGVYIIFLYWKRQQRLYREQRNFISQVTHELKSPLASIQLHLETIRLRNPPQEKVERFLDTMLADTERLNNLISNLLMAAKLEQRRREAHVSTVDLSSLVTTLMERKRAKLPEGGNLALAVENGIRASVDAEEIEMVLRNLFENAILYSPAAPDISVELKTEGKNILLSFSDKGLGIPKQDLKKIFRMFYRVRQPGENIRGSGLGLYIVKSVVTEHGGTVRVTSEGPGRGSTFIITLPRAR